MITMLPDSPEVTSVVAGKDGVLEAIRQGSLFIDMSTIAPATAKSLHEWMQKKGVEALDAPVSGGQAGAEGKGESDHSAIALLMEQLAGI